jgi:hypothetical protein
MDSKPNFRWEKNLLDGGFSYVDRTGKTLFDIKPVGEPSWAIYKANEPHPIALRPDQESAMRTVSQLVDLKNLGVED